ncbi:MAG: protein-L-isoaspartate(D-aspartate) O-methyltransferase [Patescibacteria group bacterium]
MSSSFSQKRQSMVAKQLICRGISDKRVLEAMQKIPREEFVPNVHRDLAYEDAPLEIGFGQTISQPYVVARMCELLNLKGDEKVLDIGSGSGYQAAVLSKIADQVFAVEVIPELVSSAKNVFSKLNYDNITVVVKNGRLGLSEYAPFDAIKSAAASNGVPEIWFTQLKVGGRIVAPIGKSFHQNIVKYTKTETGVHEEIFEGVRFVPLINTNKSL